jgi:hypothetical protein
VFVSFLLDQKGPKNQGSSEICLSSLRNPGKKYFSAGFLLPPFFGKFLNGQTKEKYLFAAEIMDDFIPICRQSKTSFYGGWRYVCRGLPHESD